MKKISYILLTILAIPSILIAQNDDLEFSQDEFIWFVKKYHPISVQSDLLLKKGESTVRKARGSFDPIIQSSLDQKYFDGKNYFSLLNGGLRVPTWYGIELKTGYDQNTGEFLNPQNNLPASGLWYAGISVPIGKGLVIDERRATLKKAQIYAESTEAERQNLINDLFFEALKSYWYWVESWNQLKVHEESVELAKTRFEAVKLSFEFGDKPAIDTLEAFIQVQNRQINKKKAELIYQNQSLSLSNFLWFENNTPLELSDSLFPPLFNELDLVNIISPDALQKLMQQVSESHPEMQLYDLKLASMEVDRQLKVEELKPKVNLNYNALVEPIGSDATGGYSSQNYKWGFDFSFPIFLRKQRGELQITKLKIQDTQLDQRQKLLELKNKILSYYNEQKNLQGQVNLFIDAVGNYSLLLDGEKEKFDTGESALFLVNSRETNLIQARIKLIELVAKYNISNVGLIWATGNLYNI